jgi:hypothetical protein
MQPNTKAMRSLTTVKRVRQPFSNQVHGQRKLTLQELDVLLVANIWRRRVQLAQNLSF